MFDALKHGFCSLEADFFFRDGKLYVAHDAEDIKASWTLESKFLDPLAAVFEANGGRGRWGCGGVCKVTHHVAWPWSPLQMLS